MGIPIFILTVYPDKAYIDPQRYFFFDKELRNKKLEELRSNDTTFNLSVIITEDNPPPTLPPCAPEVIGDGS